MFAVRSAVGYAVGCVTQLSGRNGFLAGQNTWKGACSTADLFPYRHGRQVMPGNCAPQALDLHHPLTSGAVWWVTAALLAIGIAVLVLHRHFRSHHLRSRIRYDLLPTAGFDPAHQAVVGFAHQLGRVRPVHGWVPRAAVGVRILFSTDRDDGKLIMSVEGRTSITGVINKLVYPQVEMRRNSAEGETSGHGEG